VTNNDPKSANNNILLSPLRYPGSKHLLIDYFQTFLRANGIIQPHLFEPFAGGASLSLGLLARGVVDRVTLIERDPLVYAFWKCIKRCPDELCEKVWKLDVSLATWKKYQRYLAKDALARYKLLDLAVAGLFFNRANFSGIIGAKPIGGMSQSSAYPIDCRFNRQALIGRICDIAKFRDRMAVCAGDGVAFMKRSRSRIAQLARRQRAIVYVDPPYYQQGKKLYRYHFDKSDHQALAKYMNGVGLPWLVSYDNDPFILDLFERQKIIPIFLKYTVKQNRRADELLITNQAELPYPVVQPAEALPAATWAAVGF